MSVVAPSSSGAMPQQTQQQMDLDANDAGARMSENFLRQMRGVDEMKGAEVDRFDRRREQGRFRQGELAKIEQGMADRDVQAAEIEASLRDSGLAGVADRFRGASRTQGFNAARRGLQGGSADIQQQVATESRANTEAEQVAANAADQRIRMQMQTANEAAGLKGNLMSMSPFESMMMGQEQQNLGDMGNLDLSAGQANDMIDQGNQAQGDAWATGLQTFLGSAGNVGRASLIGSA